MKTLRLIITLVAVAAVATVSFAVGQASGKSPDPGSAQDPIALKSYVDTQVSKLQQAIDALPSGGSGSATIALEVVSVPAGKSLIGQGGTEFILRSGTAKAIASSAGGLADITTGVDLGNGAGVPLNHMLLIPRSDNRGLKAINELVVMVRGAYEIR
jgi:hypothetical protein